MQKIRKISWLEAEKDRITCFGPNLVPVYGPTVRGEGVWLWKNPANMLKFSLFPSKKSKKILICYTVALQALIFGWALFSQFWHFAAPRTGTGFFQNMWFSPKVPYYLVLTSQRWKSTKSMSRFSSKCEKLWKRANFDPFSQISGKPDFFSKIRKKRIFVSPSRYSMQKIRKN